MDLYTLTDTFLAKDVVDEYVSAIWTERYSVAGDCQIVAAATTDMMKKLKPGTNLAMRGSKEIMTIDTISIENNQITALGSTLLTFLNSRYAWFRNIASSEEDSRVTDYSASGVPVGQFISQMVDLICINPSRFTGDWAPANLDWDREIIPGLLLGEEDTSGGGQQLTMPIGPLYTGISELATREGIGISLYLASSDPDTGYVLRFKTYSGVNRTSKQNIRPLIRLVPDMDSLSDLKEVRSIAEWKNVCYVYYKGRITIHYETHALAVDPPDGFDRRSMVTTPSDGKYAGVNEDADIYREQHARDALANHNYIRAVDGRTSPQNDFKYGIDYGLGDTIELQGLTGTISEARVTEYIRSEDSTGEKEYPSISVIKAPGEEE